MGTFPVVHVANFCPLRRCKKPLDPIKAAGSAILATHLAGQLGAGRAAVFTVEIAGEFVATAAGVDDHVKRPAAGSTQAQFAIWSWPFKYVHPETLQKPEKMEFPFSIDRPPNRAGRRGHRAARPGPL
jgi:hypothetical protein